VANLPHREGSQKDKCHYCEEIDLCDQWHLAFCGGGCVATTQAPPPNAKSNKYCDFNILLLKNRIQESNKIYLKKIPLARKLLKRISTFKWPENWYVFIVQIVRGQCEIRKNIDSRR